MKFLSPHPVNIPRAWPHYGWVQKSGSEAQQKDGEESAGCHGNAVQAAWFYQQGARVFCLSCRNLRQFISTARRRLWSEGKGDCSSAQALAGAGTLWRTRPRSAGDTPGSKVTTQSYSCKGYSMAVSLRGASSHLPAPRYALAPACCATQGTHPSLSTYTCPMYPFVPAPRVPAGSIEWGKSVSLIA